MDRAHQFTLGGERHFSDAFKPCIESLSFQPGFTRSYDQCPFGRVAMYRPATIALMQHSIASPVGSCKRTHELELEGTVNLSSSFPAYLAFRSVTRTS